MARKLQLQIAEPCHENWEQMTPAEQGRFCGSCQKQVVDFSSMSDSQLAAFFKKPSNGSVCGRFFNDQLERDLEIPRKRIPWVRYFFQFALPAFLMSAKATAQGTVKVKRPGIVATPTDRIMMGQISVPQKNIGEAQKIVLNGKVVDENNNPVAFASVMVKGTLWGVSADSAGAFKLSNVMLQNAIVLEVSCAGYEKKEITITTLTDLKKSLIIQLTSPVLSEVVVVGYPATGCGRMQVMGGISVSKGSQKVEVSAPVVQEVISPKETQPMIKIYPNPVPSGTSINIGCEKLEEGYYIFQLFNHSGQKITETQIWIDREARVMNVEIPAVVTGNYLVTLTNKESGKKFTEKIIVQ